MFDFILYLFYQFKINIKSTTMDAAPELDFADLCPLPPLQRKLSHRVPLKQKINRWLHLLKWKTNPQLLRPLKSKISRQQLVQ